MDDVAFEAAKAEHHASVAHTLAVIRRCEKVIASVKEAKARSQAAIDVMIDAINAAHHIAVLGAMSCYPRTFQQKGLMPYYGMDEEDDFDGSMSIGRAKQESDDKFLKMKAIRVSNIETHCQDGLDRRIW
jgi:hypothetical protein